MADEPTLDPEFISEDGGAEAKIAHLKEELKRCRKEKEEYLTGWQRAKADWINKERKGTEERDYFAQERENKILRELIELADIFEKAFTEHPPDSPWVHGIRNVYEKLRSVMKSYGLKEIETTGAMFNPLYHEAVGLEETENAPDDGRITGELQRGYIRNGSVLRPSRVQVARFKE